MRRVAPSGSTRPGSAPRRSAPTAEPAPRRRCRRWSQDPGRRRSCAATGAVGRRGDGDRVCAPRPVRAPWGSPVRTGHVRGPARDPFLSHRLVGHPARPFEACRRDRRDGVAVVAGRSGASGRVRPAPSGWSSRNPRSVGDCAGEWGAPAILTKLERRHPRSTGRAADRVRSTRGFAIGCGTPVAPPSVVRLPVRGTRGAESASGAP